MRGGFPDLSCPAGGGPCRAICFREDWLASPVPVPPRTAENPGMGSGGELFFQDCKRIKVFLKHRVSMRLAFEGGSPCGSPLAIGKGNFQLPLPVDGLWMLCFGCLPLVRGREAGPEAGCPKRIRAGMCSIEDSLSKDRLPGQPRDDGECIGFGMIY